MRISELVERSGVPLPTVKYYLREGLLHGGRPTSATSADYDESHLRRLALVRALIDLAGLPLARVRDVLALVEHPQGEPYEIAGQAVAALPPYPPVEETPAQRAARDHPLARAAIEQLGWTWDPRFAGVGQLERALAAVRDAGIPMTGERLAAYGPALHAIAETDIALGPDDPADYLAYAVLGTALYEPVVLALRRLAHQDVSARAEGRPARGAAPGGRSPSTAGAVPAPSEDSASSSESVSRSDRSA